jgi:hypothetical protein
VAAFNSNTRGPKGGIEIGRDPITLEKRAAMRNVAMKRKVASWKLTCVFAVAAYAVPFAQPPVSLPHNSGQTIAPVFEGWEPNPDGTFSLYFGYMNRNYKEELDIPVGPANHMEPGDGDRGQPTHFLTRRRKKSFRVSVPKDFGNQTLVWSLSIRDHTEIVPGSLNPKYQINTVKDEENGNTPPVVTPQADVTVAPHAATALTVAVTDDGLPKRRDQTSHVVVEWSTFRGPGVVLFNPATQTVADGKATTTATFSSPGQYVVQAVADDGSKAGTACCWTNAEIRVTVK